MIASNYDDVLHQLTDFGLDVDALEPGRIVRCRTPEDRVNKRSGWYSLFEIQTHAGDWLLVGSYGDWREGGGAHKVDLKKSELSAEEKADIRKRIAADRRRAEQQRKKKASLSARRAEKMWQKCQPTGCSDYLERKCIGAHGIRFTEKNALVIPMCDTSGRIHGLQFILSKAGHAERIKKNGRDKEFWPFGLAKKGHFHMLGAPLMSSVIMVTEGYATAASMFEACEIPVAAAFDAGNLGPVAEALKKRYPKARILIGGDDDYLGKCRECGKFTEVAQAECRHCEKPHGKENTGIAMATRAVMAVFGAWLAPSFSDRGTKKLSDFNDLHIAEGLQQVRSQLETKLAELGWDARAAQEQAREHNTGGRGEDTSDPSKSLISVADACVRYSLIYAGKGTLFDHQKHILVPKTDVLDILPDHGWRDWKHNYGIRSVDMKNVGFDPGGTDKNIKCNLWGGWPTKPDSRGSCEMLLDLLRFLCSEEENGRDTFDWVMRWLAYPIQNPGAKMRSALIFHGPQGSGKNLFFDAVMAIYGEYGRIIDQPAIEDRFNDWASKKLFMIADEVVARAELYHVKNKLKGFITGEWMRINPKNVAAHDERNHVNLVFLSNELLPSVLEKDDRRHCVVWTPRKAGREFYSDVGSEVQHGGVAALHAHLLNIDIKGLHTHTEPPMTVAKTDLIALSCDSPERFVREWKGGELKYPCQTCASAALYQAYRRWCTAEGERFPVNHNRFSATVSKVDGFKIKQVKIYPGKAYKKDPKPVRAVLVADDGVPDIEMMKWYTEKLHEFEQSLGDNDGF